MNSVPASARGAASGVAGTVQNAGSALSIGVFFSLMIVGLSRTLPRALTTGLTAHGVPTAVAAQIGQLPPVGSMFAAFLGYNPIQTLLAPTGVLTSLPASDVATLTGKEFFPRLISGPFHHGLIVVFGVAAVLSLIGAIASFSRGGRYVHADEPEAATSGPGVPVGAWSPVRARASARVRTRSAHVAERGAHERRRGEARDGLRPAGPAARPVRGELSLGHFSTLATLERHGPQRIGDLARAERTSAPVMTRIVACSTREAGVPRGERERPARRGGRDHRGGRPARDGGACRAGGDGHPAPRRARRAGSGPALEARSTRWKPSPTRHTPPAPLA